MPRSSRCRLTIRWTTDTSIRAASGQRTRSRGPPGISRAGFLLSRRFVAVQLAPLNEARTAPKPPPRRTAHGIVARQLGAVGAAIFTRQLAEHLAECSDELRVGLESARLGDVRERQGRTGHHQPFGFPSTKLDDELPQALARGGTESPAELMGTHAHHSGDGREIQLPGKILPDVVLGPG